MKLLAALLLATAATAHPGGLSEIYIPHVAADQIRLDGELTDWSETLGLPVVTAAEFHLWQGDQWHPKPLYTEFTPQNLDFRIWIGWSPPGQIFMAADFQDDLIRDERSAIFVQSDGLAVSVTPQGRKALVQYYAVRPKWIKPFPYVGNDELWSSEAPFALGAWADRTPTTWAVEFFVTVFDVMIGPDDHAVSELAAGDEIDLTLSVIDWDADDERNASFNLSSDHTVRAVLLSPGETAVRQQTWGETKALRK